LLNRLRLNLFKFALGVLIGSHLVGRLSLHMRNALFQVANVLLCFAHLADEDSAAKQEPAERLIAIDRRVAACQIGSGHFVASVCLLFDHRWPLNLALRIGAAAHPSVDPRLAFVISSVLARAARIMDVCKSPSRPRTFLHDVVGFLATAIAKARSNASL